MKFQTAKKFFPKASTGGIKASPLSERIMRWYAWAEEILLRFGIRTRRLPFAGRIFLLRQAGVSVNRRVNYLQIHWQPFIQLNRRASTLQRGLADRNHSVNRSVNIKAESRNERSYNSPGLDSREVIYPARNVIVGARDEGIKQSIPRSLSQSIPRFLSEMTFRSHELTKLGGIIHRQNNYYFEKLDLVTRQFVEPRQRVETRPGDRRGLMSTRQVLHRDEVLRKMDSNEPVTPVFHKNRASHEPGRADVRQIRLPTTTANTPVVVAPPQLDLSQIADQVIRQLDRRLVIWRERTGRV